MKHQQAFSFYQYYESTNQTEQMKNEHFVLSVLTINKLNEKQLSNDLLNKINSHLNYGQVNSREEMVQLIRSNNMLDICAEEVKQLFQLLEDDFSLIKYKRNGSNVLKRFTEDVKYREYVESIKEVLMSKVMHSLSKVYRIIRLDKL